MFDYLNSLIGHAVQQPAPQHIQGVSAVANLVADDPNAPPQSITTKALVTTTDGVQEVSPIFGQILPNISCNINRPTRVPASSVVRMKIASNMMAK